MRLAPDIDLTGRIIADQNDRQARDHARASGQGRGLAGHLEANPLRQYTSIQNLGRHLGSSRSQLFVCSAVVPGGRVPPSTPGQPFSHSTTVDGKRSNGLVWSPRWRVGLI